MLSSSLSFITQQQFAPDLVEGVTSHVIHKQAPKWSPPQLEDLDLQNDIRLKFFHANVKRKLFFANNQDYHQHPYRRYGLPSEKEILETKSLHNLRTVSETVDWFDQDRKGKFGVRQKVEDVLSRHSA